MRSRVSNEMRLALMACNVRKLALRFGVSKKTHDFYSIRIRLWVFFGLIIQPLFLVISPPIMSKLVKTFTRCDRFIEGDMYTPKDASSS